MRTVDFSYTISEERLRAYAAVPDIERLRWLDELVRFTMMWRLAKTRAPRPGRDCVASSLRIATTQARRQVPSP